MVTPEYRQEFEAVIQQGSYKQTTWGGKREQLTKKYAWAIPTETALDFLASESQVSELIEVGAGGGYWAYEIQRHGGNIKPIDIEDPIDPWVPITVTDYTVLDPATVTNLFLCWPPANSAMAENCLTYTDPTNVYFVGFSGSTITGNQSFHKKLKTEYTKEQEFYLPSWTDNTAVLQKYTKE